MKKHSIFLIVCLVLSLAFTFYSQGVADTPISTKITHIVPINQDIDADKVTITLSSKWAFGTIEVEQKDLTYELTLNKGHDCFFFIRYWSLTENEVYDLIKTEMVSTDYTEKRLMK